MNLRVIEKTKDEKALNKSQKMKIQNVSLLKKRSKDFS